MEGGPPAHRDLLAQGKLSALHRHEAVGFEQGQPRLLVAHPARRHAPSGEVNPFRIPGRQRHHPRSLGVLR
jgi:hypothetical protein